MRKSELKQIIREEITLLTERKKTMMFKFADSRKAKNFVRELENSALTTGIAKGNIAIVDVPRNRRKYDKDIAKAMRKYRGELEEALSERMEFDDFDYRSSHGKAPKGKGNWAFAFEHPRKNPKAWFAPSYLTYAQAKKAAEKEAKKRGAYMAWTLG